MTKDGIFRSNSIFCENETFIPSREATKKSSQCKECASKRGMTILELSRLIGKLESTAQAVLPAQSQVNYLQRPQTESLKILNLYQAEIEFDQDSQEGLPWWAWNLISLCDEKSLVLPQQTYAWIQSIKKRMESITAWDNKGGETLVKSQKRNKVHISIFWNWK